MIKTNKKLRLLLFTTVLFTVLTSGYSRQLSDQAEISILTIGPGDDELYSAFGHSAIRVYDPRFNYDAAYNYGTFDFDQPNFYLNFAKGYLVYKLAVQDAQALIAYYKRNNRSVHEQVLNLTQGQKEKVFQFLFNNGKPENADYYYDYFYDNCATKIGDVFVNTLDDEFRFDESFVSEPGLTIRELTDRYSAEMFPWGKLGIDLCLGMPMDKKLTNLEYLYLPDYVFKAFEKAEIKGSSGWDPVVAKEQDLFVASPEASTAPLFTPNLVFWLSLILVIAGSLFILKRGKSLRWFDFILFFVIGFLGLFLLVLWLATDHAAAAWNLNLLWAWPTHLIVSFLLLKKVRPRWVNWYLLFTAIGGVLLVILWPVVPQGLNNALIPITLLIVVRSIGAILD